VPITEPAMTHAKHIAAIAALGFLQGCLLTDTVLHNFADLDDYRIFANRTIARAPDVSSLQQLGRVPNFMATLEVPDEHGVRWPLDRYLEDTRTVAFVVLHDERIVYERYGRGYGEHSLLNSFSVAKAILATLVGTALADGRIRSLDSTVAEICPDFAATPYGGVKLSSLLTMTSGMVDPPSLVPGRAQYYYGKDLHDIVSRATREDHRRHDWRYSEADAQVLGYVLEAAVGKPLSAYLAEKLWTPLGMESDALWSLDSEGGMEKAFCCISARARDFARFGLLYARGGRWHGEQLLPVAWAGRSALPGIPTFRGYTHQHFWWTPPGKAGDFYAYGHDGQYVYVDPRRKVVIVKFSETARQDPVPMFRAISDALISPKARAEVERLSTNQLALSDPSHH